MPTDFERLLCAVASSEATDLFLKAGQPPYVRAHGQLSTVAPEPVEGAALQRFSDSLMGPERAARFAADRELNFAFDRPDAGRFRVNALWQQGCLALVFRHVKTRIPSFDELHLPGAVLTKLLSHRAGLILITGSTDCGKSTTVAAMLEYINQQAPRHIVTLEDPVEFQFRERRCLINQREVGIDTTSFEEGLKNVLRQSPDVVFLSDLRDRETMESAMLAAEAGKLVMTCLHTMNAQMTVERIVAFYPPHQQALIRLRLSLVLRGLVSLRLVPARSGGRLPVAEILIPTPRVRDVIREGQTGELPLLIQDGLSMGMCTFTQSLLARYRNAEISLEDALRFADSPEELQLAMQDIRTTRDVYS